MSDFLPDEEGKETSEHQNTLDHNELAELVHLEHGAKQRKKPADNVANHPTARHGNVCRERVGNMGDAWENGVEHNVDGVSCRDSLDAGPDNSHGISIEDGPDYTISFRSESIKLRGYSPKATENTEATTCESRKPKMVHGASTANSCHEEGHDQMSEDDTNPDRLVSLSSKIHIERKSAPRRNLPGFPPR